MEEFDVVIVGGGLVGMSLAATLQGSRLKVLQIEAQAPVAIEQRWDERHFALGKASIERLQAISAWPASMQGTPIREVHVSRAGEFGRVLLRASDMGLSAYGATAPARLLVAALEQRLQQCSDVQRWRPARLIDFVVHDRYVQLRIERDGGELVLSCRLLVAADGTESAIRAATDIPVQRHAYGQTAIVCTAETERPHCGRAFERFTDDGPLALLPLVDQRCGVVCTLDDAAAAQALALQDADYIELLQRRFGHRLGRFTRVGRRQPWPLRLMLAERVTAPRVVLIGNAAQTIHPIGAQGFNLGLRDATALADAVRSAEDPGAPSVLEQYEASRTADRELTVRMSDGMVRLSSDRSLLLKGLRGVGMALVDRIPVLSQALAQSAMGYRAGAR